MIYRSIPSSPALAPSVCLYVRVWGMGLAVFVVPITAENCCKKVWDPWYAYLSTGRGAYRESGWEGGGAITLNWWGEDSKLVNDVCLTLGKNYFEVEPQRFRQYRWYTIWSIPAKKERFEVKIKDSKNMGSLRTMPRYGIKKKKILILMQEWPFNTLYLLFKSMIYSFYIRRLLTQVFHNSSIRVTFLFFKHLHHQHRSNLQVANYPSLASYIHHDPSVPGLRRRRS